MSPHPNTFPKFCQKGKTLEINNRVCILGEIAQLFFTGQQLAEVAWSDETRPAYITHQNTSLLETINYPLEHPIGTHCEWIITPDNAPEVYQIMFQF